MIILTERVEAHVGNYHPVVGMVACIRRETLVVIVGEQDKGVLGGPIVSKKTSVLYPKPPVNEA